MNPFDTHEQVVRQIEQELDRLMAATPEYHPEQILLVRNAATGEPITSRNLLNDTSTLSGEGWCYQVEVTGITPVQLSDGQIISKPVTFTPQEVWADRPGQTSLSGYHSLHELFEQMVEDLENLLHDTSRLDQHLSLTYGPL